VKSRLREAMSLNPLHCGAVVASFGPFSRLKVA